MFIIMNIANNINTYADLTAYNADTNKDYPNVSYIEGTDEVKYVEIDPNHTFGSLTVKYNIVDTTQEVTLFNGGGASSGSSESGSSESGGGGALPTTMIVDGVSETPINTWRFTTVGEHIVQYEFADNIVPQSFISISAGAIPATEVIVGTDITEISPEAFDKELTSATCLSTTPPTMSTNTAFGLERDYPIYVPAESVNTYKTAGTQWSSLETRIFAIQ